jgi:hypothetical protein
VDAPTPDTLTEFDRRKWPRLLDPAHTKVWFSTPAHGAQTGTIVDVSLGGYAMDVDDTAGLQIGQKLVVVAREWLIPANVLRIFKNEKGSFRVSLEWVRPESNAANDIVDGCRSDE